MKKINSLKMIKKSRHIEYFNTLDSSLQKQIVDKVYLLVNEEREYYDKGNYDHLCNLLTLVAIYLVLQENGKTEEEAFNIVKDTMHAHIQKYSEKFQKLSKKKWFWPVIKKIVPIGFRKKSGYGWRYTWHNDTPKNIFVFETNECIYQKILKKRNLLKLGPLFCQCDVINYGNLHQIDFQRTKTLCYGDDECNFRFVKYDKSETFERTKCR